MRDYHRRRMQKNDEYDVKKREQNQNHRPLSAKAQTSKFRLGQEKGKALEPFVPVKSGAASGLKGRRGIRKSKSDEKDGEEENVKKPGSRRAKSISQVFQRIAFEEDQNDENLDFNVWGEESFDERTQESLPYYEEYFGSSLASYSPGAGSIDPFNTTALLITPRIQLILHHYCECQVSTIHSLY